MTALRAGSGRSRFGRVEVDYEGRFTLDDVEPGGWEIVGELAAEGRQARRSLELRRGESATVDLDFSETDDQLELTLVLNGAPLAGARVTVTGSGPARAAESDYQGRVWLGGIEGESATVAVRVGSLLLRERKLSLPARPAPTLEYQSGSLEITITDATTAAAVKSGLVELRSGETTLGRFRIPTTGILTLEAERGVYELVISVSGRAPVQTRVEVAGAENRLTLQLPAQ